MVFEGGDLSRLLDIDLKGAVLGAVRDVHTFYEANYHADEFKILGLPPTPYVNSGVLLIDTAAFVEQDFFRKAVDVAANHPEAIVQADQSMINGVLKGNIAELHPGWNWMPNIRLPAVGQFQPIMFRHFITDHKPFRPEGLNHDWRFHAAYHNFFRTYAPQWLSLLPAIPSGLPGYDAMLGFQRFCDQRRHRKTINAYIGRFSDEWSVIRWRPVG
jgi:lipopolysaccharide biosynthesis glycosyltransferase